MFCYSILYSTIDNYSPVKLPNNRSSKPLWETEKRRNRWKPVSNELKEQLESVFSDDKSGIVEIPDTELNVRISCNSIEDIIIRM